MKIIEALKKTKDLLRKADDLKAKVKQHSALSTLETPEYGDDQKQKVLGWVQAHSDIIKELLRLRLAIQKTNLETEVTIEIGGKQVTQSIAAWIHRRRDLAALDLSMYKSLTDRGIREGISQGPGGIDVEIKIVRFYDPESRDTNMNTLAEEPALIDGRLEVVNAVTDLIET